MTSYPAETNEIVTEWLPVASADWPVNPQCSQIIYSHPGESGRASAFDLSVGASISTTLTCLPNAVTAWINPPDDISARTVYGLGPIACAAAYTTATTTYFNADNSTVIFCCPSNFDLVDIYCASTLIYGQAVSYIIGKVDNSGSTQFISTSKTVTATDETVHAPRIFGFKFAEATPTVLSSTTPPASKAADSRASRDPTATNQAQTNPNSPQLSQGPQTRLSASAKAGIGVGVSLSVLGIVALLIAFLLLRRQRIRFSAISAHQPDSVVPGFSEMASPHIEQQTPVEMSAEERSNRAK